MPDWLGDYYNKDCHELHINSKVPVYRFMKYNNAMVMAANGCGWHC